MSKLIQMNIEIKSVSNEVIKDTLIEVFLMKCSSPLVKTRKKTPTKGKNIKIDKIGQFILNYY